MEEVFVKKKWVENDVTYYLHFQNGQAVAQIEVTQDNKVYLSIESPVQGNSMLYDQALEELELEEGDYISKDDFLKVWSDS